MICPAESSAWSRQQLISEAPMESAPRGVSRTLAALTPPGKPQMRRLKLIRFKLRAAMKSMLRKGAMTSTQCLAAPRPRAMVGCHFPAQTSLGVHDEHHAADAVSALQPSRRCIFLPSIRRLGRALRPAALAPPPALSRSLATSTHSALIRCDPPAPSCVEGGGD